MILPDQFQCSLNAAARGTHTFNESQIWWPHKSTNRHEIATNRLKCKDFFVQVGNGTVRCGLFSAGPSVSRRVWALGAIAGARFQLVLFAQIVMAGRDG